MDWRLLEDHGVAAAPGLATDELLAQRAGAGSSPPTLRLYTYRPHCALVGRFQNVAHEVHEAHCRALGADVNRRPTGGGAILMGPDQLGIALALGGASSALGKRATEDAGPHGGARALMQRFSAGIVRGLAELGVQAEFRGKNDLAAGGRKIAGLGISRDPSGGLLFHASLLVDLDVALMAHLLRLPLRDPSDPAEIAALHGRTTTVRACAGRAVAMDSVRAHVAGGFGSAFGIGLTRGRLSPAEAAGVDLLVRDKYASPAWLHQESAVADMVGAASLRTAAGTVHARVALAGRTIKSVLLRGDFFENEAVIADLEARLRWQPAARVGEVVAAWASAQRVETVPPPAFAAVIERAVGSAAGARPAPYACFLSAEAPRG